MLQWLGWSDNRELMFVLLITEQFKRNRHLYTLYTHMLTHSMSNVFTHNYCTLNDADSKLVSTSFRLKPLTQTLTHMQKKT